MQIRAKGYHKLINRSISLLSIPPCLLSSSTPTSTSTSFLSRQPAAATHLHLSEGWSPERKRGDGGWVRGGGRGDGRMEGGSDWARLDAWGRRSGLHAPGLFCVGSPTITAITVVITQADPLVWTLGSPPTHTHTPSTASMGPSAPDPHPHTHYGV